LSRRLSIFGVRTAIVCEGAPVPLLILVLSVRPPFFGLVGGHLRCNLPDPVG